MIHVTPFQWQFGAFLSVILGVALGGVVVYFIMHNIAEKKKRRPQPILESILNKMTDLMYDARYTKATDREIIELLRNHSLIMLWLSTEASTRLMKKVEKEKKPTDAKPNG